MNEVIKTVLYVVAAAVVVLVATFTYPKQEEFVLPDLVGKVLFEEFDNPDAAAELYILKFREDVGEFSEFEVARDANAGLWVIPSSANYPADAAAQVRDAATSLIDLQVLDVASKKPSEHETYGVVEPKKQMDRSQPGVGLLVKIKDAKGNILAELIIGRRVKHTADQHFVRKPGIDSIYVVKVDPSKFPTDFQQWIERDLLKLNTLDIERLIFKDYSIVKTQTLTGTRGTIARRFEADVAWDAEQNQWRLNQLTRYRNDQSNPTKLLDTEELNQQTLEDLKSALDNMKIVGVVRKPVGLGADLKAGKEIAGNQESLLSLSSRGFYFPDASQPELHAANGELSIGLKDGVQYGLLFGEIAKVTQQSEEGKLSRYLFVSARLDESKFPPLELKPLPGDDNETAEDARSKTTDNGASSAEQSDLELQRERIRKENQRKIDQREEQLRKAHQRIDELNARFADWYYVISEDEYRRVHLSHNDLIRESAKAREEGFGIDAFRQLQEEGLERKRKDPSVLPPAPFLRPGASR